MAELKYCPFCGPGKSCVDVVWIATSERYRVYCGACGASSGQSPRDKTEAPAIAAWNRRADPSKELIDAIEALICSGCQNRIGWTGVSLNMYGRFDYRTCYSCKTIRELLKRQKDEL